MLYVLCLCILVSSMIPRYDLGRQTPQSLGASVIIEHSSSKVVLRTMKHIVIYPSLGLSLEVIALRPVV
jgi:hypothetical protein